MSACTTCNVAKHSKVQEIQFGGGGGIAGIYSSNKLLANGKVYKGNKMVAKLSQKETCDLFTLTENITENKINPGNVSCYINIIRKDTIIRILWGFETTPDSVTLELYRRLNTYIQ